MKNKSTFQFLPYFTVVFYPTLFEKTYIFKEKKSNLNSLVTEFLKNINKDERRDYINGNNTFIEFKKLKRTPHIIAIVLYLIKSPIFRYKMRKFLYNKYIRVV